MAKIATFSNWGLKFLGIMNDHWRKQGHDVRYEMGYNPDRHEWSDVCFVDVGDNNAQVASGYKFPNSKLAIRVIDIEAWCGQPGGVNWENADVCIFGAKHIEELVRGYVDFPPNVKVVHIPFGVDLDRWTFRERDGSGKNIACVAHQWTAKNLPLLFQVVAKLGDGWTLHLLGTKSGGDPWQWKYYECILSRMNINYTDTGWVDDLDAWLEDKDFHVLASYKEAFSYVSAQCAAKGIKPLIHPFWGASDIWPESWLWNTVDECVDMILHQSYDSQSYRTFIEDNYSLKNSMNAINEVCGIS